MKYTIVMDNPKSWYASYVGELEKNIRALGHDVSLVHTLEEIQSGDCAFYLSCERIVKPEILKKNKHNVVVHSSALPQGKGWSPLSWQIVEGKNDITNTIFEAVEKVDAGVVYDQEVIHFEGHELLPELHKKQGESINRLVMEFVKKFPNVVGSTQTGEESFYLRRTPAHSRLDPQKTIAEQFNILRVVDNEKYPAFFKFNGHTYILKIYSDSEEEVK